MSLTTQLIIASVVLSLILMVEHWFPWERYFRKEMGLLVKYGAGIMAIMIPFIFLLVAWKSWNELIAICVLVLVAGIVTCCMHAGDKWSDSSHRATAAESAEKVYKDGTLL